MSENIPESVPTSADPRSHRPTKKRALGPSKLAADVEALFAKPDRDIYIPGSKPDRGMAPPPEIVANVQGSSAGAGSGEFHVYKASRRREYERLRLMDEQVKKEEDEKDFQKRKEEQELKDREKTDKNRAKREKARARKAKQKKGQKGQKGEGVVDHEAEKPKKKLAPNTNVAKPAHADDNDHDEEAHNQGGEVKNSEEIGLLIEDDD